MYVQILGSGTSQVSQERVSTSYYLRIGEKQMLVDCGSGTLVRMSEAGIGFKDIDIIFISHFHVDHICDLSALLLGMKYPHLGRGKDLRIIGPAGFEAFYRRYIEPIVFSKPFELFTLEIVEIGSELDFDDFRVEALSTHHTPESIAFKFLEKEKTLVIGGDMGYDETFIDFSKEADILILECSYDNSWPLDIHLTPSECGTLAKNAQVGKLIITHLYPLSREVRLAQTKEVFEATSMAEDLMEISL
ncbi:MAG: MBL fold metallo-hydrolase [Nanobdellota archaeon]